jgi:hypothetical protein
MSFGLFGRLPQWLGVSALLLAAMPGMGWAQYQNAPAATFGIPSCASCAPCQTHHCPPAFKYCYEGPPHIHWTRGCPHPICNPCDLPHFGYFDTCWTPWPFPPMWGHCPTVPPAALVNLNPLVNPNMPVLPPTRTAPTPLVPPGSGGTPMPNSTYEELQQPRRIPQ